MTKLNIALLLLTITSIFAQNKTVEKSVWNAQVTYYGLYVNNERALSDKIALRVELGLNSESIPASAFNTSGFVVSPILNIEPRYYYNIENRAEKGKKTAGNSANFIALSNIYQSDVFQFGNVSGAKRVYNDLFIIPKYGMRRVYNHFHFEAGAGVGIVTYFGESKKFRSKSGDLVIDLHLRIGYNF